MSWHWLLVLIMERKDIIFLGFLAGGLLIILACQHRRSYSPLDNTEPVVNLPDTETVGMSLSPDLNPPTASPFKGRYLVPPPLMGMLPQTNIDPASNGNSILDGVQ
jgi:hypothetical protein